MPRTDPPGRSKSVRGKSRILSKDHKYDGNLTNSYRFSNRKYVRGHRWRPLNEPECDLVDFRIGSEAEARWRPIREVLQRTLECPAFGPAIGAMKNQRHGRPVDLKPNALVARPGVRRNKSSDFRVSARSVHRGSYSPARYPSRSSNLRILPEPVSGEGRDAEPQGRASFAAPGARGSGGAAPVGRSPGWPRGGRSRR